MTYRETFKPLLDGKGEPHPFSAMFPPISQEDFDKLVEDIKKNGLLHSIVVYQGKILDGNNRFRACLQAKVPPRFLELLESSDAEAQSIVISANIHRRHLTPEQRREIIATLLKADPSQSNRQVADTANASHHTVEAVRAAMEATGQVAQLEATTGKDGKTRKRKGGKGKAKGGASGSKPTTITYQEVVNAKTALNAYSVLEEHLLDALQDVNDKSSFAHADEYARRTIEKLEEKLGQLQLEDDEEAEAA